MKRRKKWLLTVVLFDCFKVNSKLFISPPLVSKVRTDGDVRWTCTYCKEIVYLKFSTGTLSIFRNTFIPDHPDPPHRPALEGLLSTDKCWNCRAVISLQNWWVLLQRGSHCPTDAVEPRRGTARALLVKLLSYVYPNTEWMTYSLHDYPIAAPVMNGPTYWPRSDFFFNKLVADWRDQWRGCSS